MTTEIPFKKSSTSYSVPIREGLITITVNEEVGFKHVSVHEWGEPCSGVIKHWGTPEELIEECEQIIAALKKF